MRQRRSTNRTAPTCSFPTGSRSSSTFTPPAAISENTIAGVCARALVHEYAGARA
jgi:hypothetical protein